MVLYTCFTSSTPIYWSEVFLVPIYMEMLHGYLQILGLVRWKSWSSPPVVRSVGPTKKHTRLEIVTMNLIFECSFQTLDLMETFEQICKMFLTWSFRIWKSLTLIPLGVISWWNPLLVYEKMWIVRSSWKAWPITQEATLWLIRFQGM